MKKCILLLFVLFFVLPTNIKAQTIQRAGWYLAPVVTTTNPVYSLGFNVVRSMFQEEDILGSSPKDYMSPYFPRFRTMYRIGQKIKTPDGNAEIKWWDWKLQNFSLGYCVGYFPYNFPVGFIAEFDYERQNWNAKLPGKDDYVNYSKQMIMPVVCARIILHMPTASLFLEPGIKFNKTLSAKGDYDTKDYVNDGITGIFALGTCNKSRHIEFLIRYERDFFDFFNQDFTAPDGTKPYKDFETSMGAISITMRYHINFVWQ